MSHVYELIEAVQPYAKDGTPIWQAFSEEFTSPRALAGITADGHPDVAAQLKQLHNDGNYRAAVKLFDAFFDREMAKLAAQGHQWAINYLECCRDKEALFELLRKHGIERMRELIELERRTEAVMLGWAPADQH